MNIEMKKKFLVRLQMLLLALCLALPGLAAAQCETNAFGFCGDCSAGTPCCGYGPCNFFCGNCDGGCRHGPATEGNPQCIGVNTTDSKDAGIGKAVHEHGATPPASTAKPVPQLVGRALFDSIDADHDGLISLAETEQWVKATGRTLSKQDIKQGFDRTDLNHDGKVQPAEFDRNIDAPPPAPKAAAAPVTQH